MNTRQITIGLSALMLGALVYLADRPPDATWFVQTLPFSVSLHGHTGPFLGFLGGSLPAFTHVFAMTLLTAGVLNSRQKGRWTVCLSWLAVDFVFELGQGYPETASRFVPDWFGGFPLLDQTTAYFQKGSFDYCDLAAILAGTLAAFMVLQHTDAGCTPTC